MSTPVQYEHQNLLYLEADAYEKMMGVIADQVKPGGNSSNSSRLSKNSSSSLLHTALSTAVPQHFQLHSRLGLLGFRSHSATGVECPEGVQMQVYDSLHPPPEANTVFRFIEQRQMLQSTHCPQLRLRVGHPTGPSNLQERTVVMGGGSAAPLHWLKN